MLVNRKEIIEKVKICKSIQERNHMPILDNILIKDNRLSFTNLEYVYSERTKIKGNFLLPLRTLKILQKIKGERIEIYVDDDELVINNSFRFLLDDVLRYPLMPDFDELKAIAHLDSFSEKLTKYFFENANKFVMDDIANPKFSNIFYANSHFYTTNGHIVFKLLNNKPDSAMQEVEDFTFSGKHLKTMYKLFNKSSVNVYNDDKRIMFKNMETEAMLLIIKENVSAPKFERILAVPTKNIELNRNAFIGSVENALICSSNETNRVIILEGKIYSSNKDAGIRYDGDIDFPKDVNININGKKMMQIVSCFDKKDNTLDFNIAETEQHIVIKNDYMLILIMCLRNKKIGD